MLQPFIVLGDKTDHGGAVTTASPLHKIHGKPTARLGDLVACPRCRGVFPIVEGNPTFSIYEVPAAFHGAKTGCGARLISSQVTAVHEITAGGRLGVTPAASPAQTGDIGSGMSAGYLDQPVDTTNNLFRGRFRIIDAETGKPVAGVKARIRSESGKELTDATDADGCTQWVMHDRQESLALFLIEDDSRF